MQAARLEVQVARLEVQVARLEVQAAHLEVQAARLEVQAARVLVWDIDHHVKSSRSSRNLSEISDQQTFKTSIQRDHCSK